MLPRPCVCAVTDRRRHDMSLADLVARIHDLAHAGIDLVQIRERDLNDRDLFTLTTAAVEATRGTPALVLVNDRADVAIAAGAAGVHLRGDSVPVRRVRAITPPGFIIGRSVHRLDEALAVARDGACDYLLFGTVFPSSGKPAGHLTSGTGALATVCRGVMLPVLAIGGINRRNAESVAATGAAGLAAVDALFGVLPDSVGAEIAALRRAFDSGSQVV